MANRRSLLQRALAGLGQGVANASDTYLANQMRMKFQDRIDARQNASAIAAANRAEDSANRQAARGIMEKISTGDLDPEPGAMLLSVLTGKSIDPSSLDTMRPALPKRLSKQFAPMMSSQFPEGLPTDEEIMNFARNNGGAIPGADVPTDNDPYLSFKPEVRDFSSTVGARRRALMSRPTERIEGKDPNTNAPFVKLTSAYDPSLQSGLTTGPTASQQGALEGDQRVSFLNTAGPAEAKQAGEVAGVTAGATEDARNTPSRQAARTREAVTRETDILRSTLPYKLDLAKQTAALEIQQAVNKENATNVASAIQASGKLMGPQFFDRVVDITNRLNTQTDGLDARLQGAGTTLAYYLGGAPDLKELEQVISQNRRLLGQAMGVKEGNPSDKDMENVRHAIGLDQWSTREERMNALRNLQDMISVGPTVASRMSANAGIAERVDLAKQLTDQRRAAEQEAIQAGATEYNDPVTHMRIKVISYR